MKKIAVPFFLIICLLLLSSKSPFALSQTSFGESTGKDLVWSWNSSHASPLHSSLKYRSDYSYLFVIDERVPGTLDGFSIQVLDKNKKMARQFTVHFSTTWCIIDDIMYCLDFGLSGSQVNLWAFDLVNRDENWSISFDATGGKQHSAFFNRCYVVVEGDFLVIRGYGLNDAYIKYVNPKDGQVLLTKRFDLVPEN